MNIDTAMLSASFKGTPYKILEKIGEGGFGQVFKAENKKTHQIVAIKLLTINSDFSEDKKYRCIKRFEREALLVGKLNHPNIVRLLDKGQAGNLLYAVFEYVHGESLKAHLAKVGTMSPSAAGNIMADVLDALSHAHKHGVIHRDIKPANIMLLNTGVKTHAKILDFGIGTVINISQDLDYQTITLTRETLGTPAYSAPEQLRGEPPTHKTDLYVWGLVFVECLTGQPAVTGSSIAAVFHKQLSPENIPLPQGISGHPLSHVLRKALNKKPSARVNSAQSLYHELGQINLATLVGSIEADNVHAKNNTQKTITINNDQTRVNTSPQLNTSYYQSNHVEIKQIMALSITLTLHAPAQDELSTEILDTLHRDQISQCIDIATHYGAYHVGTLGDTLLFYFGYPKTHDIDNRLGARTALDILSNLKKRNALLSSQQPITLEMRAGINTGKVTVFPDTTPVGAAANTALELGRLAKPNQILCANNAKQSLDTYVEFQQVKNNPNKQSENIYELTGERQSEALGFLRAQKNNHDFIGREDELNQIKVMLGETTGVTPTQAIHGIHLCGEAGIGKSRMILELKSQMKDYPLSILQCLPEHKNNALYPVLVFVKQKLQLDVKPPNESIALLQRICNSCSTYKESLHIPLLCSWLNLPSAATENTLPLPPNEQIQELFEVLKTLLTFTESENKNSIIIFEDMHWADPTTQEFVDYLIDNNNLTLTTSRTPLEKTHSNQRQLSLLKLTVENSKRFVNALFGQYAPTQYLLDTIVQRADGIPLFIEELIQMLRQQGLIHTINGVTDFLSPQIIEQIPSTLRDSLQQKLDTLYTAKEVAQTAAAIGREFDYTLLQSASPLDEEHLQTAINELLNNELIFVQRKSTGDTYLFKHALVRDTAYDSMTQSLKKEVHMAIAMAMETDFENIVNDAPFDIARHFSLAHNFSKAIQYETLSAQKALDISSSRDCISHCNNIHTWAETLTTDEKNQQQLSALILKTIALMNRDGWAGDEVSSTANQCLTLADNLYVQQKNEPNESATAQLVQIYYAIILHNIVAGNRGALKNLDNRNLIDVVNNLKTVVTHTRNTSLICAAYAILGYYHYTQGDFDIAQTYLENSIEQYNPETDFNHGIKYGFDSRVWSAATLSLLFWLKDENKKANEHISLAINCGEQCAHMPSLCIAQLYQCILRQYQEDTPAVLNVSEKLIANAKEYDLPAYLTYGLVIYYWAINQTGDQDEEQRRQNLSMAQGPVDGLKQLGCFHAVAYFESLLADIELSLNEPHKACKRLELCIDLCKSIGEHYYHPMLPYRKALIEEALELTEQSQASLQDAINWAEKTTMKKVKHLALNQLGTGMAI